MKTRFDGPSSDQLYVRLDPLAGGTGGVAARPRRTPAPTPP